MSHGSRSNYLLPLTDLLHPQLTVQLDRAPHEVPWGRNWARSGRWGSDAFRKAPWVAAQDSSCVHILDFSHFFPAPRPPCRPETLQTHHLPFCLTEWWCWHLPVGFWAFTQCQAGLPKVIAELQVNPGLSQALITLRVGKGTKGSARHTNSSGVKRNCSTWTIPGIWTLSRPLTEQVLHLITNSGLTACAGY